MRPRPSATLLICLIVLLLSSCVLPPPPVAQPPSVDDNISLAKIEQDVLERYDLVKFHFGRDKYANGLPLVLPNMDKVEVQEIVFRTEDGDPTEMFVYSPPDLAPGERRPAVVVPSLFTDAMYIGLTGDTLPKDPYAIYHGLLMAADGFVVVMHNTEHEDDLDVLMQYINDHADELQIDFEKIGFWSCCAMSLLSTSYANQPGHENIKFVVTLYGAVAVPDQELFDAYSQLCRNMNCFYDFPLIEEFRTDLPMLIVRAGLDEGPAPNGMIDYFVAMALEQNLDMTLINHPTGATGFDDSQANLPRSRQILETTLQFMHDSLSR